MTMFNSFAEDCLRQSERDIRKGYPFLASDYVRKQSYVLQIQWKISTQCSVFEQRGLQIFFSSLSYGKHGYALSDHKTCSEDIIEFSAMLSHIYELKICSISWILHSKSVMRRSLSCQAHSVLNSRSLKCFISSEDSCSCVAA